MIPTSDRFQAPFEQERCQRLLGTYESEFGTPPQFVVRAPGRVNLLGEHTDYNGLPVLPMAIDRSVLIAGRVRVDRQVRARNTAQQFTPRCFELAERIPPYAAADWGNYLKAAAQGLQGAYGKGLRAGADLCVDGNIPSGAGLSSSSALVVAAALGLLAANELEVPFPILAEILPAAEQYVGTLSGGMDQAISLLAQAGHALRIDFFPLRQRAVGMPEAVRIVVCDSLVTAEKSGAAKQAYNQRVIEGRLACRILETLLGTDLPGKLRTLGDLVTRGAGRPLTEFLDLLAARLPDRALTLDEITTVVGTGRTALRASCAIPDGLCDSFSIVRRVRHILTEARRVEQAEVALRRGNLHEFGRLMDESHASCRDDYEISCTAIEELIGIAKRAGALGARLTGAGFGGCTVNLVRKEQLEPFVRALDESFYARHLPADATPADHRFVFSPQCGAEILRV